MALACCAPQARLAARARCDTGAALQVDVFSFGIVLWELLTGEEPYRDMHHGAIIGGIVNNTLRPTIPAWCDPAWRALMERCWAQDQKARPSFKEISDELRAMYAQLAKPSRT